MGPMTIGVGTVVRKERRHDPAILALRQQQAKNFLAILFLSQGVPMMLAGDEVLRTQRGNNNAYCQDNEMSWFDWTFSEAQRDMLRFVQHLIAFRQRHSCLRRRRFLTGKPDPERRLPDVTWHGVELDAPLWGDPNAQILAYTLGAADESEEHLHIMLNMSDRQSRCGCRSYPTGSGIARLTQRMPHRKTSLRRCGNVKFGPRHIQPPRAVWSSWRVGDREVVLSVIAW